MPAFLDEKPELKSPSVPAGVLCGTLPHGIFNHEVENMGHAGNALEAQLLGCCLHVCAIIYHQVASGDVPAYPSLSHNGGCDHACHLLPVEWLGMQ